LATSPSAAALAAPQPQQCLKLLSLGDWGTMEPLSIGMGPRMAAAAAAGSLGCASAAPAVLLQGDNFYSFGVDSAQDSQFDSKYQALFADPRFANTTMLVMQGNHDHYGSVSAQIEYSALDPTRRWTAPALNYSWTSSLNGVSVFLLTIDTYDLIGGDTDDNKSPTTYKAVVQPEMMTWIAQTLASPAAQAADWLLVRGHYPVYSASLDEHGDTRGLVVALDPLLQAYRVDAYLSGHEHILEHIARGTVNYFSSGAGGVTHTPVNAAYVGLMGYLDNAFGYMSHVFTKSSMTTRFHSQGLTDAGENVTYAATIASLAAQRRAAATAMPSPTAATSAPAPPPSAESGSSAGGVAFAVLLLLVSLAAAAYCAWRRYGARWSGGRVASAFGDDGAFSAYVDMRLAAPYRGGWGSAASGAVPAPDRSIQMV